MQTYQQRNKGETINFATYFLRSSWLINLEKLRTSSSTVITRMSNRPNNKRKHDHDLNKIITELPKLSRSTLEAVAKASLESSPTAVSAAEKVLATKKVTLQHCLRCHEDFDPEDYSMCTMYEHDQNNGLIESGTSGMCWLNPCCLKDEDSGEPCWTGTHVTSWSEFSDKEKEHWCNVPDTENYWQDREFALLAAASKANNNECLGCKVDNGCSTCCTCDGDEDDSSEEEDDGE